MVVASGLAVAAGCCAAEKGARVFARSGVVAVGRPIQEVLRTKSVGGFLLVFHGVFVALAIASLAALMALTW